MRNIDNNKINCFLGMKEYRKHSAQVKLKLLLFGVRDNPSLFSELSESFKEEHYAYDNGNWGINKNRLVPTELLLPGGIVSKVHFRPDSPLFLKRDNNGSIYIYYENEIFSEVTFLQRPSFWNFKTRSGKPTKTIAQMYGLNALNFNIFSGCEFHDEGVGCSFCSVKTTVDKNSPIEIEKQIEDLEDVCMLAAKHDNVNYLIMTGGSYIDRDFEFDRNISILKRIKNKLPWNGQIKGNVSFLPPKNINKLKEIFNLGVTNPSFNIEVWPESNFQKICPGKAKYVGFNHIIDSLLYLSDCYGKGSVWSNFVAGITSIEDIKSGYKFMAENGIVPGSNIYHAEVGSLLGKKNGFISEHYVTDLYSYLADLYYKYNFQPYFDTSVLRNSLANEFYEGLF